MAFADRSDAGRRLAALLPGVLGADGAGAGDVDAVAEGMARGGVPVAAEVARRFGVPLDVVVVRKLGYPHQPELGLGAIAEEGVRVINATLVAQLGVSDDTVATVAAREEAELERRLRRYRRGRPPVAVAGRTAVVVDDGLATGFTARAAVEVMRRRGAARVVLAVPVAPPGALSLLRAHADEVVCVEVTERFRGISEWYEDFHQVSDAEVAELLAGPGAGP